MTTLLLFAVLTAQSVPEPSNTAPARIFSSPNGAYGLRILPKEKVIGRACGFDTGPAGRRVPRSWAILERTGTATLFGLDPTGAERPVWTGSTAFPDRGLVSGDGRYAVLITLGGSDQRDRVIYQSRPSLTIHGPGGKAVVSLRPEDLLTTAERDEQVRKAGNRAPAGWTEGVEFRVDDKTGRLVVTTPLARTVTIDLGTGDVLEKD